ncbi:hypothetical protein [Paenarthrobacter sp. FR1]|uniref:hypothetical protein n=1 Tax=Paenarthrobacter sp. FR1 TaxID=3439548 RepID=UPI003DA27706
MAARLPYGVFSEIRVLGGRLPMNMGTHLGELLLPGEPNRSSSDVYRRSRLSPPPGPPLWDETSPYGSSEQQWGKWNGAGNCTIQSLVLHVDHTYMDDGRPTYPIGFPKLARAWISRLADWLAVLADGTTDIVSPEGLTWQNTDIQHEALMESSIEWLEPKYALTLEQWRFALDRTSAGDSAPFPLALIAAAQRSAAEGDLRRAVFDAASAAETALSDALERAVVGSHTSSDFYQWAMHRKTFGPLVDVSTKIGLQLPKNTKERLLAVRNNVAHPANLPTEEKMMDAVEVAADIVREHYLFEPSLKAAMCQ